MSKCSHNREVLDAYTVGIGRLDDLDRVHIAGCSGCTLALAEARRLRTCLSEYASETARRADRILADGPVPALPHPSPPSSASAVAPWLATAAAIVLIVAASTFLQRQPAPSQSSAPVRVGREYFRRVEADSERVQMTQYLNQTHRLLLSLLYGATDCDGGRVEIAAERDLARDLLRRKKLLEPELSQPWRGDIRPVFDELELLLFDVAGGDGCISRDQLDSWKQIVEKRGTLRKLELLQMKGRI